MLEITTKNKVSTSAQLHQNGHNLDIHIEVADTALKRIIGLLGRKSIPENYGLLLTPCSQVHTFFMRFPIDVVLLDRSSTMLSIQSLPTWKISKPIPGTYSILELKSGAAEKYHFKIGQKISL